MATIYITSNANSGTGTLRDALSSAESGDVIQPDPAVFPQGTNCVVPIASVLTFPDGVTVDGAQTRIVVDGSGMATGNMTINGGTAFRNVDFVELSGSPTAGALWFYGATSFEACSFYGISAARSVFYVRADASVRCVNCVIAGNRGTNDAAFCFLVSGTSSATFANCTIIGNVSSTGAQWNREPTLVNCKTTTAGLVSAAELAFDDWSADAWQSWNLRFKSPAEDGARGASDLPTYDLDGNPRVGAVGAYEALEGVEWSGTTLGLTNATIKNLTFAPSTVNIAGVNVVEYFPLDKATTLNFTGGALSVSELATGENVATLTGNGYLGTTRDADLSNVETAAGATIKRSTIGAGIVSFNAVATGKTRVSVVGEQTDATLSVVLEYQASGGAWESLDDAFVLSDEAAYFTAPKGTSQYRAFDGEKFVYDWARWGEASGVQFSVVAKVVAGASVGENWQCVFEVIGVDSDNIIRVGQSVTILARVFDAFDESEPLLNAGSNIARIKYSCERKKKELFETAWRAVEGHESVEVPTSALLETVQDSDAWSKDGDGFNFTLTPDTSTHPLFPEVGQYRIVVTITPTTGNPVVFYVFVSVVDSAN